MTRGAERRLRAAASVVAIAWLLGTACASVKPEPAPRTEARQQLSSARTAYQQRQWKAAAGAFGRAALAFAALGDGPAEALVRRDEGEALRRAGEPRAAAAANQRALELDRRLVQPQDEARDLVGLARSAADLQQMELAIQRAEAALAIATPGTQLEAVVENDLALYLLSRGDPGDSARVLELLSSALASNQARGDALGAATNELNLGRAGLAFDDPKLADSHLQGALNGFQTLQDPEGLAQTHEMLARLSLARHEVEQVRFHREQARAGFEFLEDRAGLLRVESLVVE